MSDERIPLAPPTKDDLEEAARIVLGDDGEAPLGDDGAKVFTGMKGFFLQGAGDPIGEWVGSAPPELQDRLMAAAAEIRKAQGRAEAEEAVDPARNPMIRIPD